MLRRRLTRRFGLKQIKDVDIASCPPRAGYEQIVADDRNGVDPRIAGEDSKTGAGIQVDLCKTLNISRATLYRYVKTK